MNYHLNLTQQPQEDGGNYEIHTDKCEYAAREKRVDLGTHESCQIAKEEAKIRFPSLADDIDGCVHCCKPCHGE